MVNLTPKQAKEFERWVTDEGLLFEWNGGYDSDGDGGSKSDGNYSTGCLDLKDWGKCWDYWWISTTEYPYLSFSTHMGRV